MPSETPNRLQTASVADENSKSAYRHSCENSSSHPSGCRHLYPEIPSFPRKWESRNEKQQEFIGNNRNRTDWIPACAGMTDGNGARTFAGIFYVSILILFLMRYSKKIGCAGCFLLFRRPEINGCKSNLFF
ncbi:hypothetical protein RBZ65_002111, partial [Neisseria gonorrhoeae]